MRRSTIVSALVLAGLIASPALLNAQENPTDTAMVADRDDRSDWGWLGLLGLAGLIGLKRRDRVEPREQARARQAI